MKKIISLLVLLLLLSGCTKKDALYYQDMSEVVISLFQDVVASAIFVATS